MTDSAQTDPLIGAVIHGFRVEKKLGEGGMGKVFAARHESLPIYKVVKVLLPDYSRDDQIRARFLREAEAVATMDHPHVITVDNFGTLPSGELFLMMPLLSGRALDEYLQSAGKLGAHHALQIAAQVGSALQHAHARGIIHRDLKPGNIFVERKSGKDTVKLLDFGIAKDANARLASGARTRTGMAIGTPHYMACEQYDNAAAATTAADTFALAVIVVEMLTGQLPWGVHDQNILYFRQKTETPTFGREIPRAWIPVLTAGLAPNPAHRPSSSRALVVALADALDAIPPVWPAGTQIVKEVAPDLLKPDLIKPAAHDASTIRASTDPYAPERSAPDMTATVDARPVGARPAALPPRTTLSASSGVITPTRPTKRRFLALVLLGMLTAAIVGALVSFVSGAARSGDDRKATEPDPPPPPPPPPVADAAGTGAVLPAAANVPADAGSVAAPVDAPVDAAVHRSRHDAGAARAADAASPDAAQNASVRLEIQPGIGDFVASTESCGDDAVAFVDRLVKSAPRIDVAGASITLTINGKHWTANRSSTAGSYIVGFFDQDNGSVVAITVHQDNDDTRSSSVEITRFVRESAKTSACSDKWRGQARRL